MESMTIACTRCGATQDGDIILPPIAFTFKHNSGCGHGVGPLAILPSSFKKKPEKKDEVKVEDTVEKRSEFSKEEIKVEEKIEKPKSKREKIKVFGKKD